MYVTGKSLLDVRGNRRSHLSSAADLVDREFESLDASVSIPHNASMPKTLVFLGGTGKLGQEVAPGLATADYDRKIALVRPGKNVEGFDSIEVEDMKHVASLREVLKDAHTIVSTLSGPDLCEIECAVIEAAPHMQLFVPSQYGVDSARWEPGFPFLDAKRKVLEKAATVPTLVVAAGGFADQLFFFLMDVSNGKVTLVDGGQALYSFTRRRDIGYALARILSDPKYAKGGTVYLEGSTHTWKEATGLLEQATGRTFEYTDMTVAQAKEKEQEMLSNGLAGDMGQFYAAFGLHLLRAPADGSTGINVSEGSYDGYEFETLEQTIADVWAK